MKSAKKREGNLFLFHTLRIALPEDAVLVALNALVRLRLLQPVFRPGAVERVLFDAEITPSQFFCHHRSGAGT